MVYSTPGHPSLVPIGDNPDSPLTKKFEILILQMHAHTDEVDGSGFLI